MFKYSRLLPLSAILCAAVVGCSRADAAAPNSSPKFNKPSSTVPPNLAVLYDDLIPGIRQGRFVLYLTLPDTVGEDVVENKDWFQNCPLQRMIGKTGVDQSAKLRSSLVKIGFKTGPVYSGRHCASLTLGRFFSFDSPTQLWVVPELDPDPVIRTLDPHLPTIRQQVRGRLETLASPGYTLVISGHPLPPDISPEPVLTYLGKAEAVFFEPLPSGQIRLAARLTWGQVSEMAAYAVRRDYPVSTRKNNASLKK
jgi:hypothetical protein